MSGVGGIEDTPIEISRDQRRVLVVNRVGYLGGVERIILTLADGMEALGWRTVLAIPNGGALARAAVAQHIALVPYDFDRMRITANPRVLARYPWALKRCAAEIKLQCSRYNVSVIHVHHPVTALYALSASKRFGIPIVLHVHETLPAKRLYALALSVAVRQAAVVLCVSKAAMELALTMGVDRSRARVVHNGVDRRFLADTGARSPPRELSAAGPGPHVGVFGVLEPRKAQHVFLQAAMAIIPRFPTARFWLVGPGDLKDKLAYADTLRRMAAEGPLRGRVSMVGFQSDIAPWLAAMDVVVQPSVAMESFGMSLVEALTFGKPVIASRVGGMPEVVRHGETGLIVPPGDAQALATALTLLLESPEKCRMLGANGATDAGLRFAPAVFQQKVAEAYETAVRERM